MRQCLVDTYPKDQLDEMGDLRLRMNALDPDDLLATNVFTERDDCTTPRITTLPQPLPAVWLPSG